MRNGILRNATLLLFAVGLPALAGGHAACVAQTGAELEQARLSLSADIEEVLQSPFHAGAASKADEKHLGEAGIVGSTRYHQRASGSLERAPLHGAAVGFTFILAEAGHLVGAYLLRKCGFGQTEYGCVLGPALTVPAVALPAVLLGGAPWNSSGCIDPGAGGRSRCVRDGHDSYPAPRRLSRLERPRPRRDRDRGNPSPVATGQVLSTRSRSWCRVVRPQGHCRIRPLCACRGSRGCPFQSVG